MAALSVLLAVALAFGLIAAPQGNPAAATVDLKGTVRELGTKALAPNLTLVALWPENERWVRQVTVTSAQGEYRVAVKPDVRVRLYATGEYSVPTGWALTAPVGSGTEFQHDVWLRPLRTVTVSGRTLRREMEVLTRAQVVLAALDQLPDGSVLPIRPPLMINTGEGGRWRADVPAGEYDVWAQWADLESDTWSAWFCLHRRKALYQDAGLDLLLTERPWVRGTVIDASADKPAGSAYVELHTHAYLKQLRMFTSDGTGGPDDPPAGGYAEQASTVDLDDFTVVVAPTDRRDAIAVIPGMNLAKLKEHGPLRLRDAANGSVSVTVKTAVDSIPVSNYVLTIRPSGIVDVPAYIRPLLELEETTSGGGAVTFWGLPRGRYALFGDGERELGEIEVTGKVQAHPVVASFPFITGKLTYPDGSPCLDAVADVTITLADGSAVQPVRGRVFENQTLLATGEFFIPLHWTDATYVVTFGAAAKGEEAGWLGPADLPFVSEPIEVKPAGLKRVKQDVKLAARKQG